MDWTQALLLGLVQGLTEFLPVSSSGHLMIARELLGIDSEGFLDFTVTVHLATVLSTLFVFRKQVFRLFAGLSKLSYNDETDYVLKLVVSMVPVAVVGLFLKDSVEALFEGGLLAVALCLLVTAALLGLSDLAGRKDIHKPKPSTSAPRRNGLSFWQALVVGLCQSLAVAPGLSRSGATIAGGLLCGVGREAVAQFSFLMVLVPILGEQLLDIVGSASEAGGLVLGESLSCLAVGFVAAFASGLLACKVMVALVKKARLAWFALYCAAVAACILVFA